jgi:hypothetical protein
MTLMSEPSTRHPTVFLLSPALVDGPRGKLLRSRRSTFPTALQLRQGLSIPIADVFTFISSLYFRGKIAYARSFARCPAAVTHLSILVIAPGFGLVPPDWPVTLERLERMSRIPVDPSRASYVRPLRDAAIDLHTRLPETARVVLLGSLATGKYLDVLAPCLGDRLHFPSDFMGRGDMQRGSMMLNASRAGTELSYRRWEPRVESDTPG